MAQNRTLFIKPNEAGSNFIIGTSFKDYTKEPLKCRAEMENYIPLQRKPTEEEAEVLKGLIDWDNIKRNFTNMRSDFHLIEEI